MLAVTSFPNRTSPVVRGKWILENLLGTPLPPPPPDVPALKEKPNAAEETQSMRERIAQHRANPACASCHAMMDPLGLSLENYDFVGRWRTVDEALMPIDASGALPDGTKFDGPAGLRNVLLEPAGSIRADGRGKNAHLRARTRARALRHAGGAHDHARRRTQQLPRLVADPRRRQQPSLPDAETAVMIITRIALPRRTFIRGLGATLSLPLLDAMVPAFSAAVKGAAAPICRAWASSTCRTASR